VNSALPSGGEENLANPNLFSPLKHHKGIVHCNANNLINAKSIELIRWFLVARHMAISACRGKGSWQGEEDAAFASEDLCGGFVLPAKGIVPSNRCIPYASVESDLWKSTHQHLN
jgi:hypothetical protein